MSMLSISGGIQLNYKDGLNKRIKRIEKDGYNIKSESCAL